VDDDGEHSWGTEWGVRDIKDEDKCSFKIIAMENEGLISSESIAT